MAEIRIRFAESALRDLEDVQLWYADQGVPEVGERFVAEVMVKVEGLATHPDRGRTVPEFGQSFLSTDFRTGSGANTRCRGATPPRGLKVRWAATPRTLLRTLSPPVCYAM